MGIFHNGVVKYITLLPIWQLRCDLCQNLFLDSLGRRQRGNQQYLTREAKEAGWVVADSAKCPVCQRWEPTK